MRGFGVPERPFPCGALLRGRVLSHAKRRIRGESASGATAWALGALLLALAGSARGEGADDWEARLFSALCAKYASNCPAGALKQPERNEWLEQVAVSLGRKLATEGTSAVDTRDIASVALLLSRKDQPALSRDASEPAARAAAPQATDTGSGQKVSAVSQQAAQQEPSQQQQPREPGAPQAAEQPFADIGKGQEGFVQGVDRLSELPVSERMVITGDITSGVQAATVTDRSDLTSTFGRVRVNFVTRAVPASADGRLSEGYFLVQMRAAGGPFDASAVGGPSSFSPLNDVATDRSRFNEGTSRGNIYLAKAFYQQNLQLGDDYITGRVGIINLSDFFDTNEFANNEARQFLSSAFVNSAGYKSGISAPGFMGEYHRKVDRDWLQGLVFRLGYAVSRTERAFTSPISTAEVEMQTTLRGHDGKYRFGGTIGNVADVGGLRGFHLGFDQWVSRSLGLYGRYAWSNSGPGSISLGPVGQSYSAGLQWRFVDEQDRVSAWAFGFSQAFGIETEQPLSSERILETYYRWQLSRNFSLTPDFQLVFGSGGSIDQGTHVVTGVRMNFGF